MIDHKDIELICKVVDKEASKSEVSEFEKLIRDSEEANELYVQMIEVTKKLSEIPEVDPPLMLKRNVMDKISKTAVSSMISRESIISRIRAVMAETFAKKPSFTFATGIAFGLMFMVIIMDISSNFSSLNQTDITGSINIEENKIERNLLNITEIRGGTEGEFSQIGEIRTYKSSDVVTATIDINSSIETRIEFVFDPELVKFVSIEPGSLQTNSINIEYGNIVINSQAKNTITMVFKRLDDKNSKLNYSFTINEVIQEGIIYLE